MRSRRPDVAEGAAVERALREGLCGFGGVLPRVPTDPSEAAASAAAFDERLARRIERFADAPEGAFVWTRDEGGFLWLGRIGGPWRYDDRADARAVDLVHVRDCAWLDTPTALQDVPPAVLATFARGGLNWQQTHDAHVSAQSARVWEAAARANGARPR
ncbi:GAF domain-containing protein [Agrococcus citreus]|uniref:GAF domain-containing protein n=1 Tax=Agrococcus citreus TaxID=84643 RepID=A0ABP4JHL2_9MICO